MEIVVSMIVAFVLVMFLGIGWLIAATKKEDRHIEQLVSEPDRIEYHICEADYIGSLSREVQDYLARGWKLAGGVSAADEQNGSGIHRKYVQAIYKEVYDGKD